VLDGAGMKSLFRSAILCALMLLSASLPAVAQRDVTPGDPVFQRWPDLRQAYFENYETKVSMHKYVAMPMPRQCAFFYTAAFSTLQMSDRETRDKSVRDCNQRLHDLGALHENYSVECSCRPVIGRDKYRLDYAEMPAQVFAPFAMFYRDRQGGTARLYGFAEIGMPPAGGGQVPITIYNSNGQQVCTGTLTSTKRVEGTYRLDCLRGTVISTGMLQGTRGNAPIAHSVARGTTPQGQPTTVVIGLPSQLAYDTYGRI